MRVTFDRTVEDNLALQQANTSTKKVRLMSYLVCTFMAVLLLAKLFLKVSAPYNTMELLAIAGVSVAVFFILWGPSGKQVQKQQRIAAEQASDTRLFGGAEMEVSTAGITVYFPQSRYHYSWRAVERIQETPGHAFFFIAPAAALPLPKDAVTAGDADAFVAHARELWLARRERA